MFTQEGFPMTGWTFFFIVLGIAVLTAQFFRLIDLIERPSRRSRQEIALPSAWNVRLWNSLRQKRWTSWKS